MRTSDGATEEVRDAMNVRSLLYTIARGMGDFRAISRGPVAIEKRIERRSWKCRPGWKAP